MSTLTTTERHPLTVAAPVLGSPAAAATCANARRRGPAMSGAALDGIRTRHGYVKPVVFGTWTRSRRPRRSVP